jgi:hypothetical protein
MKYKLTLTDENGNEQTYNVVSGSCSEKTLNDFILNALEISEDKREIPVKIQCPNGLEVYPSIKMKFENYGSSILGDKLEAMHITWRD